MVKRIILLREANTPQNPPVNQPQLEDVPAQSQISQSKTNNSLLIGLVVLIILLLSSTGYLAYQNYQLQKQIPNIQNTTNPTSSGFPVSNKKSRNIYNVADFLIQFPENYIQDKRESGEPVTSTSNFENYNLTNGPCHRISGVSQLFSNRILPGVKTDLSPPVHITAWNSERVSFMNTQTKTSFYKTQDSLNNLDKYTNLDYLKTESNKPILSLDGFLFCSGGYSDLVYIQKVENTKFEKIYYAEVFEGNGTVGIPNKKLIINADDGWLIATEHPSLVDKRYKDFGKCLDSEKQFECGRDLWLSLRSNVESQEWTDLMLSSINLPN